ncbi:MAG TPA: Fe-S cluster assembly protein SufD, partial [Vicinamibacteria bacterium]|nr:Fe-S cluster assembly protein SufD [Vicinamibacteria bacterium]
LLVFVTTGGPARLDQPRNLLVLEAGCRATVVECHLGLGAGPHLTNAVTQIALGEGADLDHYLLQLEGPQAFHVSRTQASLARDSRLTSCAIAFGARLARHEVQVTLDGEGAACTLSGLAVVGGRQHLDTHTFVDHRVPRATSRQLYKGILDGQSRGVFDGRVVVRPGANGTDAQQTNKNLLLGEGVEVDSKPQLEIFADDVKCSHGAADGQVAPEAIFYLRSRGLSKAAARALLTYGFAAEVLGRVRVAPLGAWLETKLARRLTGGRVVEEAA